nr:MAG: MatK/TrnK amino terminal region [Bacteriophage sp.]
MKRYSGLHDKLCTIENIEVADDNARKNKNKKYGINKHDKNRQYENEDLVDKLFNLKCVFILKVKKKMLNLKHNIL